MAAEVCGWYAAHARDLPWRRPDASPWGILVSEVMLQQTPVSRVVGPWREWLDRWPTPADLAREPPGEAVRAWGRLGYPRRALRLHQSALAITTDHAGRVPSNPAELRNLPGVGEYTAAAVAAFAFGVRALVLDTNVRRVLARLDGGVEFPPAHLTRAERAAAEAWLPEAGPAAALWSVAAMELGAQVCRAASPDCGQCPVADSCRWLDGGRPPSDGPARKAQGYQGTDRQCRGRLLEALRDHDLVPREQLLASWPDRDQAERALAGLQADGLVRATAEGFTL